MVGQLQHSRHYDWTSVSRLDVLILDDSEFDRRRMARHLSKLSPAPNIVQAGSIMQLRDLIAHERFDIVLVDYALRDGDGFDALRSLKASELNADAFKILVTGNDHPSLSDAAIGDGFDDFLTKDEVSTPRVGVLSKLARRKHQKAASVVPMDANMPVNAEILSEATIEHVLNRMTDRLKAAVQTALATRSGEVQDPDDAMFFSSWRDPEGFDFQGPDDDTTDPPGPRHD